MSAETAEARPKPRPLQDGLADEMAEIGQRARIAAAALGARFGRGQERGLARRRTGGARREAEILAANARDLAEAEGEGLAPALRDRLALDGKRLEAIAAGLEAIAALPDPVGRSLARWTRPERARHRADRGAARRHRHHL